MKINEFSSAICTVNLSLCGESESAMLIGVSGEWSWFPKDSRSSSSVKDNKEKMDK
jgi:hypothetical protein